jgi:hypothetical protein
MRRQFRGAATEIYRRVAPPRPKPGTLGALRKGPATMALRQRGGTMDLGNLLKLVHIAAGFALVAGLFGRWSLERRAAAASDPEKAYALTQASAPFERLVLVGGPAIIVAGLLTAAVKGYAFFGLTTGWMLVSLVLVLAFPFVLAPLVYLPNGRRMESAIRDARERGAWTSELRAAFADPRLRYARWYEAIAAGVVLALMVLKPL